MVKKIVFCVVVCFALGVAGVAFAQEAAEDNPFVGAYTLQTVYVGVDVPFERHAGQMDGNLLEIGTDTLRLEQVKGESFYALDSVRYVLHTLDEASRQTLFAGWQVRDESLKRPYDLRMEAFEGRDGWPVLMDLYREGDRFWLLSMEEGLEDGAPATVLYAYELLPIAAQYFRKN